MSNLFILTLQMIAAVESSSGRDTSHPVIRDPASIHFGDQARGTYAIMPKTAAMLKTGNNEELAATRYLSLIEGRIARNNGGRGLCPFEAVLLWELGHRAKLTRARWVRGARRIQSARHVWAGPITNRTKFAGRNFFLALDTAR